MYSKEIKDQVVKFYESGKTVKELSDFFEISNGAIRNWLKDAGVFNPMSNAERLEYARKKLRAKMIAKGYTLYEMMTPAQKKDIVDASNHEFVAGIKRERRVTRTDVLRVLREYHAAHPYYDSSKPHTTTYKKASEYQKAQAWKIIRNGGGYQDVYDKVQIKEPTLAVLLRKCRSDPEYAKYLENIMQISDNLAKLKSQN